MWNYIAWVFLGLAAGAIAKFLKPGKQGGGCLSTSLLGMAGALFGGWVGKLLNILPDNDPNDKIPGAGGLITAVIGSLLLLIIFAKMGFGKDKKELEKKGDGDTKIEL